MKFLDKIKHFLIEDTKLEKENFYDKWIYNIIKDYEEKNISKIYTSSYHKDILDHFIHHIEEGREEGISQEWLASLYNLIEIIKGTSKTKDPSIETKILRLQLHYKRDKIKYTPPPINPSLSEFLDGLFKKEVKHDEWPDLS